MRKVNLLGILVVFICSSLPVCAQSVFIVDRLTDTGEGSGLMGDLRYCITNGTSGQDTITFGITGTINLTGALPELHTSVTIAGPGADQLTVRRDTGGNYRIFTVTGNTTTVVISDLTVANGRTTQGGGVYVYSGNLTLSSSILSDNQAVGANGPYPGGPGQSGMGGGIYVDGGVVSVQKTTLSNNRATGGDGGPGLFGYGGYGGFGAPGLGGGIYVAGGTVSVTDTTLTNGQATGGNGGVGGSGFMCGVGGPGALGLGGGIYVAGGSVEVFQNTLSANGSRGGDGGQGGTTVEGLCPGGEGGNGIGGGLLVSGGDVEVQHSTLFANQATGGSGGVGEGYGPDGQGMGGGLSFNMGTLRTRNTILAGNMAQTTARDLSGNLGSLGHNLIGNSTGGSGFDATDLLDVNPRLGPLQDNGGPTLTHALLEGSPAMDAGDNTDAPEFDQRGEGFPRIVNDIIDIGAFEVQ